mmetsp:Transcript_7638/g.18857  ORF Transcript_7638/g.18857 Transcript_7638/m.18857 type:complete len:139 (+) Transcript_7638:1279-1695(+)
MCTVCPAAFVRSYTLQRHIYGIHAGLRPFQCEECGVLFPQSYDLMRHLRFVHNRVKQWVCPKKSCQGIFARFSDLKRHVSVVHDKIRAYSCEICGHNFEDSGNLTPHVEAKHKKRKRRMADGTPAVESPGRFTRSRAM